VLGLIRRHGYFCQFSKPRGYFGSFVKRGGYFCSFPMYILGNIVRSINLLTRFHNLQNLPTHLFPQIQSEGYVDAKSLVFYQSQSLLAVVL
jgi:hypothetical protein